MNNYNKISVIIPTRNSGKTIAKTLRGLLTGSVLPGEVLVVDGKSTDETVNICNEYKTKIILNEYRNASFGRRIGTENAVNPFVAFIDSDCIPENNWLEVILSSFNHDEDLDGIGGPVIIKEAKNVIQEYCAITFEEIKKFPRVQKVISSKGVSGLSFAGANCAFRKSAILKAGNFRASRYIFAEEVDLIWRMLDCGSKLIFEPNLIVEHLGYPDNFNDLVKYSFRMGIASTQLTKYHGRSPRIDFELFKKLIRKIIIALRNKDENDLEKIASLQIIIFILGKWLSSIWYRTINL